MNILSQVIKKVNEVFDETYLNELARETGFMKRKRKVEPKKFLERLLLVKLDSAHSSLEDLVYEFSRGNCVITKQGLHKRFTIQSVKFIQLVLHKLLENSFVNSNTCLGKIDFIKNVKVIDSSEIRLHRTLTDSFPQVRNQGAAIKLQALMEVVQNQIISLDVCHSKEPDQGYKTHIDSLESDDLLIGDLGYFCVDTFRRIEENKGFFLSRYFKKTHVYDAITQEKIDLRERLSQTNQETVELAIKLGISQLPCRLVALRLPEAAYQQRLKHLKEKRRKDPRASKDEDSLNRWTIFVTNLPGTVDSFALLQLYSLRWQIELFFKMMKTFFNLRAISDTHEQRALVSLYVLCIAMVLLSFVTMTIVEQEISLYKASKLFIKHARDFIGYLSDKKTCAISWLQRLITQFALKESRKNRPSTKLSLNWRQIYA